MSHIIASLYVSLGVCIHSVLDTYVCTYIALWQCLHYADCHYGASALPVRGAGARYVHGLHIVLIIKNVFAYAYNVGNPLEKIVSA